MHDITVGIYWCANTIERFHDVIAAMLVYRANPVGDELFSHVNALFCFNNLHN